MSYSPDWTTKLFEDARRSPCYGDNDNPNGNAVMFRHYYLSEVGTPNHVLNAVKIEYTDIYEQEVDKTATIRKAERKFLKTAPDGVQLCDTEIAEQGEINHPRIGQEKVKKKA